MKKKTLITVLLVALLALPLFACGKDKFPVAKKTNFLDYAIEIEDENAIDNVSGLFTAATEINLDGYTVVPSSLGSYAMAYKIIDGVPKYKFFDTNTDAFVGDEYFNIEYENMLPVVKTTAADAEVTKYKILNPLNLTELMPEADYISIDVDDKVFYENGEEGMYLVVKTKKTDDEDFSYNYFKLDGESLADATITAADPANLSASPVAVGSTVIAATTYDIPAAEGSALDGYSYSYKIWDYSDADTANVTYTVYKDNTIVRTATLLSARILGYVDGKIIYSTYERLDAAAKNGYNVVYQYGGESSTVKFNAEYFSYDILTGKTKKIKDPGYLAVPTDDDELSAVQNSKTDKYDAFAVYGVKLSDGVALINDSTVYHSLLVNDEFDVIHDFTGKPFSADSRIYAINANRFYTVADDITYILDEKYEVIASFANGVRNIDRENSLIAAVNGNYYDFDGKLVYNGAIYSGKSEIYNGAFRATVNNLLNGEITVNAIVDRNNLNGRTARDILGLSDESTAIVTVSANGLIFKAELVEGSATLYTLTVYDYNGNRLAVIDNSTATTATTFESFNNIYFVATTKVDGVDTCKLYKLA